jgi:hypothetical protein
LKVEKQRMFDDTADVAVLTHKKSSLASHKKAFPHKKVVARRVVQLRKSPITVGIRLNQAESVAVASALIKPPAPNKALVEAFHAHKKAVAA